MSKGTRRDSKIRRYVPAALALVIGLALAIGFFAIVSSMRTQRVEEEFERRANNVLAFLGDGLTAHFETLYAVRDFFRASHAIDREEFALFVEDQLDRHSAIRSLAWAPTVTGPDRSDFEAEAAMVLGRPYEIRVMGSAGDLVRAPDRAEYTPITFISPFDRGGEVLGFDLRSSVQARIALERAIESRALAATPWIELIGGDYGILALLPPLPGEQRVSVALGDVRPGVVLGAIEIEDLIAVTVGRLMERVDFLVFDESPNSESRFAYRYDGTHDRVLAVPTEEATLDIRSEMTLRTTLEVGGQRWGFLFFPSTGFVQAQRTIEPWLALAIGVLLTLLLAFYLFFSIRRAEQMEAVNRALESEVEERERIQSMLRERDAAHSFLAEASSILVSSLDYEATLRKLAHLAVPTFAEWCVVHVVEPSGQLRRVEVAGKDTEHADRIRAAMLKRPAPEDPADNAITRALRTGEPQVSDRPIEEFMRSMDETEEDELRGYLEEVAPVSALSIPLRARDRTLGALTFLTSDPDGFSERDHELLEDLTGRAALYVDNAKLFEDAQSASQSKSDFLAVMSHELRTPLNAIMGYVDLLLMGVPEEPSDEQKRQLERINTSARHLLDLIEEILTYSRTEAGHEEVHTEPVDLVELVEGVVEDARQSAATKELELESELPDEPVEIMSDAAKVRQILSNLLSNAIKFTNEGSVGIRVQPRTHDVVIDVWDTGIGITETQRIELFEPFWQAEDPTTRTTGGTGLGLTVSNRLARLVDGDITVRSDHGEGSTFTLVLPYTFEIRPAGESNDDR